MKRAALSVTLTNPPPPGQEWGRSRAPALIPLRCSCPNPTVLLLPGPAVRDVLYQPLLTQEQFAWKSTFYTRIKAKRAFHDYCYYHNYQRN